MLHKLGPALNQVNNELRKISPILPHVNDELRQIGPILPQLMRQQQRFEVALLDLRSELQHLKSYRRCEADHSAFCTECVEACSCTSPP